MSSRDRRWHGVALLGALAAGCAQSHAPELASAQSSLRTAFEGAFLVGAALNAAQFSEVDTVGARIVKAQFNSITPENVLKWASVHPRPGTYEFAAADRYVAFGERNGMFIVGHNLVWHNQTPRWVFQDSTGTPVSRDTLLARLRDHIHTVVGRYRGRIKGWDVVNEALSDDGTLRRTPWLTILGEDYLAAAFRFAHEADPDAELYYNDYELERAPKRRGAVELVRRDRKSTRLNSSHVAISYAVFCLKKKKNKPHSSEPRQHQRSKGRAPRLARNLRRIRTQGHAGPKIHTAGPPDERRQHRGI